MGEKHVTSTQTSSENYDSDAKLKEAWRKLPGWQKWMHVTVSIIATLTGLSTAAITASRFEANQNKDKSVEIKRDEQITPQKLIQIFREIQHNPNKAMNFFTRFYDGEFDKQGLDFAGVLVDYSLPGEPAGSHQWQLHRDNLPNVNLDENLYSSMGPIKIIVISKELPADAMINDMYFLKFKRSEQIPDQIQFMDIPVTLSEEQLQEIKKDFHVEFDKNFPIFIRKTYGVIPTPNKQISTQMRVEDGIQLIQILTVNTNNSSLPLNVATSVGVSATTLEGEPTKLKFTGNSNQLEASTEDKQKLFDYLDQLYESAITASK